jgi:hypothetical protein
MFCQILVLPRVNLINQSMVKRIHSKSKSQIYDMRAIKIESWVWQTMANNNLGCLSPVIFHIVGADLLVEIWSYTLGQVVMSTQVPNLIHLWFRWMLVTWYFSYVRVNTMCCHRLIWVSMLRFVHVQGKLQIKITYG